MDHPQLTPEVPSQQDEDFFHQHGYLPWRKFLSESELVELREEYDAVFAEAAKSGAYTDLTGKGPAATHRPMLQITQVSERSMRFCKLVHDERLLAVFRTLLGPNLLLFHDQALFKPAHHGGPVPWHQDNAYWRCRPANLVSCWLTLDDAVPENGAMQFIPDSHLRPLRHDDGGGQTPLIDATAMVDPAQAVVVPLPAGACLFHHCQTLHFTQPNTTVHQRRAFIIHVMAPGTRDGQGNLLRAGFSHLVLSLEM